MPRYEALFHVAKQHFTRVLTRSKKYVILSLKGGGDIAESKLRDLSMDFSVEVLKMCDSIRGHSSITNQLERSATSVGANIHEANYAQSKADFVAKLQIALKECYETEYWLELFVKSELLDREIAKKVYNDCGTIRRMLISSINTAKENS